MANITRDWIRSNQVAAFFLLTFLITWPGFFLAYFIFPGNQIVEVLCSWVVFGPALSAMLVSGVASSQSRLGPSKYRWISFALVWLLAAVVQILNFSLLYKVELNLPIVIICCLLAFLPAWMVSNAFARNPGIRKTFSTLVSPRGSWIWYLVIFLAFPGIPLVSVFLSRLFGSDVPIFRANLGLGGMAAYFLLDFSRGFLMTGGINEESGWRGFALPRLQSRYPVLVSALIVWFFWAAWHLPYDFGRGDELSWILENRILWNMMISIIMAWLYNRTNGSLLAPALFHPAMNTFGNMISFVPIARVLLIALAVFAVFSDRMWKTLPDKHPAMIHPQFTEEE
jgi:membrane protease YdiL (CAAX protease family)